MNTFKLEGLTESDIKSNSYEHLKVMIKNKIIQVISNKGAAVNSKEDILTYHTILQHLFATDERLGKVEASDGTFYILLENLI